MPKSNTNTSGQQRGEPVFVSKDDGYRARQLNEAAWAPPEGRRLDLTRVNPNLLRDNMVVYGED